MSSHVHVRQRGVWCGSLESCHALRRTAESSDNGAANEPTLLSPGLQSITPSQHATVRGIRENAVRFFHRKRFFIR